MKKRSIWINFNLQPRLSKWASIMTYYRRTSAKHGYYSRYIVTSRLGDSLLGIQFSVSRVNSFGRAKTQSADATASSLLASHGKKKERRRERERGGESLARSYFPFRNHVLSHLLGKVFVFHPVVHCNPRSFWGLRNIIYRAPVTLASSCPPLAFCNNAFFSHENEKDISTTLSTFAATAHYLVSAWSISLDHARNRESIPMRAIGRKSRQDALLVRASYYSLTPSSSFSYLRLSGSSRRLPEVVIISENFTWWK